MLKQTYGFEVVPEIVPEYGCVAVSKEEEEEYVTCFRYLNKELAPWADISLVVHRVNKEIPPELSTLPKPHAHETVETYAVIGDLTIEIDVEGEKYQLSGKGGPATIVIPPGVKRCRRYLGGTGYVIAIVRIPEDSYSTGWPNTDWRGHISHPRSEGGEK